MLNSKSVMSSFLLSIPYFIMTLISSKKFKNIWGTEINNQYIYYSQDTLKRNFWSPEELYTKM